MSDAGRGNESEWLAPPGSWNCSFLSFACRREEDLRKAIALSEEEEAKRKRAQEDALANALFDDTPQPQTYVYQLGRNRLMLMHLLCPIAISSRSSRCL